MKKIISVLIVLIIISAPVAANALTDKEKQEIEAIKKNNEKIMKQLEETKKQVEKAQLESQKQLEELKKKSESKAATANKPAAIKTEKYNPKDYAKYIPTKDNQKIFWIPKKVMNDNELAKYLKDIHGKIEHKISKEAKKNAEQIIKEVKKQYPNDNTALANAANGCWIVKHPEEALYIMGVACNNDPNSDNLNNYAAFITMSGAPEKAIPILNKLNSQYPNNSTILNNLGQAWFDLGDIQQAEKYLDGAIKAFAYHSQANYTKSIIEAARGNQAQAIAAMKRSLERSYSQDKESKLKKMGGKLDTDPDWGFHMPQDALGLEKFVMPPYDISSSKKWEEFRQQCSTKKEELQNKANALNKKLQDIEAAKVQVVMSKDKGKKQLVLAQMQKNLPPFYKKAWAKLRMELGEEGNGTMDIRKYREMEEKRKQLNAEIDALEKQMHDAGLYDCSDAIRYIKQINTKKEQYATEYIEYKRKEINTRTYYLQYGTLGGDDAVELMKISAKIEFLTAFGNIPEPTYCENKGEKKGGGTKLADFYDLHCDKHDKLTIPVIGSIETTCNKMTTEFNALPFLKANWTENLDTNQITKGEALIGLSTGIGEGVEMGPLKAEAKIGGGAFIEFDNNGITDYGPYAELKGEIGVNWEKGGAADPYEVHVGNTKVSAGDLPSAEIGVHARYGINSGMITANSTGLLDGAFSAKW